MSQVINSVKSKVVGKSLKRSGTEFHNFRINDIAFSIPPTQIEISHRAATTHHSYLRSQLTPKEKSGKSVVHITASWVVVPEEYWKIHRLTKMFRHTPFWEIENMYVRTSVIPTAAIHCNMAVCPEALTVSNSEGFKDTHHVELHMTWFNFRPFTQNFMFKRDWDFEIGEGNNSKKVTLFGVIQNDSVSSTFKERKNQGSGIEIPGDFKVEAGKNLLRADKGPVHQYLQLTDFTQSMTPHLPTQADHADNSSPYIRYVNWLQARNIEQFFDGTGMVSMAEGATPGAWVNISGDAVDTQFTMDNIAGGAVAKNEKFVQAAGKARIRPWDYPFSTFASNSEVLFEWFEFKPINSDGELWEVTHNNIDQDETDLISEPEERDAKFGTLISKHGWSDGKFKEVGDWGVTVGGHYADGGIASRVTSSAGKSRKISIKNDETGKTTTRTSIHNGTDIVWKDDAGEVNRRSGDQRAQVYSPINGKVFAVKRSSAAVGGSIVIKGTGDHEGLWVQFLHLKGKSIIAEGTEIQGGVDALATTGYTQAADETGTESQGPHIHMELFEIKSENMDKIEPYMFRQSGRTKLKSLGSLQNIENVTDLEAFDTTPSTEEMRREADEDALSGDGATEMSDEGLAAAQGYLAQEQLDGWHIYRSPHVVPCFYRERKLVVRAADMNKTTTATHWGLQFQNNFAHIPMDGHEYPTAHFTGGSDVRMTLSFLDSEISLNPITTNEGNTLLHHDGARPSEADIARTSHTQGAGTTRRDYRTGGLSRQGEVFMEMRRTLETNSRQWRSIPDSWLLKIKSISANTAGCRTWIVNSVQTQSIPGQPGTYSIHAEFDAARPFSGFESINPLKQQGVNNVDALYALMYGKIKEHIGITGNEVAKYSATPAGPVETKYNKSLLVAYSTATPQISSTMQLHASGLTGTLYGTAGQRVYKNFTGSQSVYVPDTDRYERMINGDPVARPYQKYGHWEDYSLAYSNIMKPDSYKGYGVRYWNLQGTDATTAKPTMPSNTNAKWWKGVINRVIRCLYLMSYVASDSFFGGFSRLDYGAGRGLNVFGLEKDILPDFEGAGYALVDGNRFAMTGTGTPFGYNRRRSGWTWKDPNNFWLDPDDEYMGGAEDMRSISTGFGLPAKHDQFDLRNKAVIDLVINITEPKWDKIADVNTSHSTRWGQDPDGVGLERVTRTNYPNNSDLNITTEDQENAMMDQARRYVKKVFAGILDEARSQDEGVFKEEIASLNYGLYLTKRPCYPDLELPGHPVLGSDLFTPPDFYFFSNSEDSKSDDMRGADERWMDQLNTCVENAWGTQMAWASTKDKIPVGSVTGKKRSASINKLTHNQLQYDKPQAIQGSPTVVDEGYKSGTKGGKANPQPRLQKAVRDEVDKWFEIEREFVDPISGRLLPKEHGDEGFFINDVGDEPNLDHLFGEGAIVKMAQESARDLSDNQTFLMRRAFPTFRLLFKTERPGPGEGGTAWQTFSQFYSYSAVKRITLTRSRKIPADLAIIELSNVGGVLDGTMLGAIRDVDYARARPSALNKTKPQGTPQSGGTIPVSDADIEEGRQQDYHFDSMMLRAGIPVRLFLGYHNNPEYLEPVFTGLIVDVQWSDNSDSVRIVCQSYAVELIAVQKGVSGDSYPKRKGIKTGLYGFRQVTHWDWEDDATVTDNQTLSWKYKYEDTHDLLTTLLHSPEVKHFGKWILNAQTMSGESFAANSDVVSRKKNSKKHKWHTWSMSAWFWKKTHDTDLSVAAIAHLDALGTPVTGQHNTWRFSAPDFMKRKWSAPAQNPVDDNLYCPHPDNWIDTGMFDFTGDISESDAEYRLYHTTIWDVFQEMTLRHPGWIASPVPYFGEDAGGVVDRMTMFFGVPSQRYWCRPMPNQTIKELRAMRKDIKTQLDRTAKEQQGGSYNWSSTWTGKPDFSNAISGGHETVAKILAYQACLNARYVPFRKYHLADSRTNIVSNDIIESTMGMWNSAAVRYSRLKPSANTEAAWHDQRADSVTVKAHNLMPEESVILREFNEFRNCHGKPMASRYAQALIMLGLREMYKGTITVLGNARIKLYDIMIIADEYNDMGGPIEVEEVTHIFTPESGFISVIVPDAVVVANEMSTFPILQGIMQWVAPKKMDYIISTTDYIKEHDPIEWNSTGWTDRIQAAKVRATAEGLDGIKGNGIVDSLLNCYNLYTWLQSKIAVNVVPLMKNARPMLAGLPEDLQDTTWTNFKGKAKSLYEQARIGSIEASIDAHHLSWQVGAAYEGDLTRSQTRWLARRKRGLGATR